MSSNGRVPLQIPAGETSRTFLVSTTDDGLDEEDTETFGVRIRPSNLLAFNARMGADRTTVSIVDNDEPPALRVADVAAREDTGSLVFTVRLDAPSAKTVTVGYAVAAGTATAGVDYTAVPAGTLTFEARTTEQSFSVPIIDDAVHEPDETLTATLSGATNATLADADATGTITDDEGAPTVSLVLTPPSIGENGGISTLTATLSSASSEAVTVTVSAMAVSPAVAGDFTQNGTTLTFAAGETTSTGTVTLTAVNNAVDEPNKTIRVSGSVTGGLGVSAPSSQDLTITDDEATPSVTLVLTPSMIDENGGISTLTATLSGALSEAVTVTVSAMAVSPAVSGDFMQSGTALTFAAGETTSTGTVTLTAVNNDVDAPDKTVRVSGSVTGGLGVSAPASQDLTITDDEATPSVTLVLTPSMIDENGGMSTVTATLSGASSAAVTVTVSAMAVSPAVSGDFMQSGTALTFAAGETTSTGMVTLTAENNAVDEPNKTIRVSGSVTGGLGVSAPSSQDLTITDDEGAPTVSLVLMPTLVDENGGMSTVTATLSGASSAAVTVTVLATAVSPAVAGDFTQSGTTLTIAAGQTTSTGTVTIAAVNNAMDAPDKTVRVTGSVTGGLGVSSPAPQDLTITDDEGAPTVALVLSPTTIGENGGVSTVTATLTGASSEAVTVMVTAGPVSPAVVADFTQSGTTLTIAVGQTTSTGMVTLTAVDNAVDSPNKTIRVTGSVTGGNGVSAPASQDLTITDDEGARTVALVLTPTEIGENVGVSTVTATLSGASSEEVTVTVSATAVSPAVAGDFTQSGTTLTIAAGQMTSTGSVTLTAVNNDVDAPDKTVRVTASVTGGSVSAPGAQDLTITDDEAAPTVTLVLTPPSIGEDGGESVVTATLSSASSEEVTVTVSATAVPPAVAGDFTQSGTTLTIAAGQMTSTGSVTIAAENNAADAPNKTVRVTGSVTGGHGVSAPASQDLTIADDEGAPTVALVVTPTEIGENGGESVVTATLSSASSETVTVTVTVTAVSPAVAADFTQSGTTLTIAAGETTSTGTVTIAAVDNAVAAGSKTVRVTGSVSGGSVPVPAAQDLTITDDEGAPTVTLVLTPPSIGENDGVSMVTATLSSASSDTLTMTVTATAEPPAVAADFTQSGTTLTIAAGETTSTGTVTIAAADNAVAAADKTVTVTGAVTGGDVSAPSPQTLTITDDDGGAAGVTLSVEPSTVSESAGATEVRVTATLDATARSESTVVTVSVSGGSASAGDDFAAVNDFTVTIPANGQAGTAMFTLTPKDDAEAEGPETVSVTGKNDVPGLRVTPAELTIVDDDASESESVTPSVEPNAVMEDAGAAQIRVRATLAGGVRSSMTMVTVSVEEDEDEYAVAPAEFDMEIAAGETSADATFTLTPVADTKDEQDQTVAVSGTNGPEELPVTGTAVTIRDDDESNRPPKFNQERYEFDLPENRSGGETPVVLGTVGARDSDGDRLRYALFDGDRERFTVSRGSGTVSYIGEGEDFETDSSQFELQVTVNDGESQTKADVVVRVVDMPERPKASNDRAETPEDTPKVIDVLKNDRDPDGDRLRVASVTVPEHGTATVVSGGVRYAPELNWYGEDRFKYTVADSGGLTSKATVKVTVTPVNDPPEAVDDEAETLEDVPMVVDVLANDSDVDGDPLEVVAVGSAGYGTTAIADGGVRYASELNWYGTDRFTYTIADPEGLTSTATVTMTVLPVNDAPEAVGVIPDQVIEEGGEPVTVDITPYFTDVDGDVLTYEAVSSDETAVTVSVSGATLTLSAMVAGTATVTVTASDVEGLTATQTFGVRVGDRLVRGVLTDTLAALGRGHLSSARMTIGRRLETGGGGMTRLMVAGQYLSLDAWDRMGAGGLEQTHELLFRAATLQQRRSATDLVGTSADPRLLRPGAMSLMGGGLTGPGGGSDRLLQGTDVLLSFGGDDAPAGVGGMGGRWTVWGQGDLQSFRGAPAETSGYDGDLRTGYLGVDARLGERWLAGVAVARSGGAGNWQVGASSGRLATELTVLHPYVRWGDRETAVWVLAGVGRGTAENVRALNGRRGASALGLGLGLVEGRRRLATTGGGLEVDLRGEASWARLRTGEGEETIDGLEAGVRRLRTGVDVTLPLGGPGGLMVAPFGEVSTRHDGGAGQTGVGLEFAGGMRLTGGRLRIEAQGADAGPAYGDRLRGTGRERHGHGRRRPARAGPDRLVAAALGRAGRRRRLPLAGPAPDIYARGGPQRRGRRRAGRLRSAHVRRAAADAVRGLRADGQRPARAGGRKPGDGRAARRRPLQSGADRVHGRTLRPAGQCTRPPRHAVRDRELRGGAARAVQPGGRGVRRRHVRPGRRAAPASMNPVDWIGRPRGCRPLPMQHRLCNRHGLRVTVAHYPPATSKWNPIEHRLFCEVTKNWAARPLDSYETILKYLRTTRTATGLRVRAHLVRKTYKTGVKVTDAQMRELRITPDSSMPKWNYTIEPM